MITTSAPCKLDSRFPTAAMGETAVSETGTWSSRATTTRETMFFFVDFFSPHFFLPSFPPFGFLLSRQLSDSAAFSCWLSFLLVCTLCMWRMVGAGRHLRCACVGRQSAVVCDCVCCCCFGAGRLRSSFSRSYFSSHTSSNEFQLHRPNIVVHYGVDLMIAILIGS